MHKLQQAASLYIEHGFSPVPLVSGQKRPLLKDWTQYKDKVITDLNLFSTEGLGLVCGFNGLEVLDIDAKHFEGNEFIEFIEILEANGPGLLKKMVIQNTPSGGFHFLYRCETIEGNKKLAKNTVKEVTFETRGIGGQIAAWPTPGYSLENKASSIQWITKEERDILFNSARDLDKTPKVEVSYQAPSKSFNDNEGVTPWDDFNSKVDCLTILQGHGWTIVREDSKCIYLKRPGQTDAPDSGKVFKDSGRLWVWSTSTALEAEVLYNAFALYTALEHNNDFKASSRALSSEGYGTKKETVKPNEAERYKAALSEPIESEEPADDLLTKYLLDPTEDIKNPPSVLELRLGVESFTLGTAGNISLIQGKAKSRKSYFMSALAAAVIRDGYNNNLLKSGIVKGNVLYFDTEQGDFHAQRVNQRILHLAGIPREVGQDKLKYYALRRADTNADRLSVIEYILNRTEGAALVIIDGVVDIANGVNEEPEAIALVSRLMKISAEKNTHIATVLHENKHDRGAKGHLGSYLVQKSETVYGVSRSEDGFTTYIEGLYTRNASFPDLQLEVNGKDVEISLKEATGPEGKEFSPGDLERIAKALVGKTITAAKEYVRDVERCKMSEAAKAINLMEAAKIISYTSGQNAKICLNLSNGQSSESPPF
tara:strand:- start:1480 stop:3444 length:1965 start_codon:yes stop_codon:yes gene_type:complete